MQCKEKQNLKSVQIGVHVSVANKTPSKSFLKTTKREEEIPGRLNRKSLRRLKKILDDSKNNFFFSGDWREGFFF
jgi:hypothetical protein